MPFTKRPYTKPGRLADVLALIQVLAFDPHAHRSEPGIIERELGHPSSTGGAGSCLPKNTLKSSGFPRKGAIHCCSSPVMSSRAIRTGSGGHYHESSQMFLSRPPSISMTAK
jgi:hypothetical protein